MIADDRGVGRGEQMCDDSAILHVNKPTCCGSWPSEPVSRMAGGTGRPRTTFRPPIRI